MHGQTRQLIIFLVFYLLSFTPQFCQADSIDDLCQQVLTNMSLSYELGQTYALKLDINHPIVVKAFERANGELNYPYVLTPQARLHLHAQINEDHEQFWERPYRYVMLQAAVRDSQTNQPVWMTTVRSKKELLNSWQAIPIRIGLSVLLWYIIVYYGFNCSGCSHSKKWVFQFIYGLCVMIIAWSYIGPTLIY